MFDTGQRDAHFNLDELFELVRVVVVAVRVTSSRCRDVVVGPERGFVDEREPDSLGPDHSRFEEDRSRERARENATTESP